MRARLGKYEILEEIGHGGMATVYRARDASLGRDVALKVLHPHLQKAAEARARFRREAQSVARLHHPGIPEIYDYSDEESDDTFLAAELLTGPTLERFVESVSDIPAEIAACAGIELARALGAAHEAGIVHRDVKPSNVLLDKARVLKLTDFGIAHLVGSQGFTATGQVLGSPGHMAPEQVERGYSDVRSDLFALGTVLYFVATGRPPFAGRNPHQVLKRVSEADFPDPQRINPRIGRELADVLKKMLALDPRDRYGSAREVEQALTEIVERVGIEDPATALRGFLEDPTTSAARWNARAVEALLLRAERAASDGAWVDAHEAAGRVLAIDDGNADALALLRRLERRGNRERHRRWAWVGGLAAALGTILLGVVLTLYWVYDKIVGIDNVKLG